MSTNHALVHWRITQALRYKTDFLDLSDLQLRELPTEIGTLGDRLLGLNLAYNRLRSLPPEIGKLKRLRTLILTFNDLTELPSEIGQLTNLETLFVAGWHRSNSLRRLPDEIKHLGNLKQLDLRGNPIPIPHEILRRRFEPQVILSHYFQTQHFRVSRLQPAFSQ